eukprot:4753227-Pyramimonas_sp.AAC.1
MRIALKTDWDSLCAAWPPPVLTRTLTRSLSHAPSPTLSKFRTSVNRLREDHCHGQRAKRSQY